MHHTRIAALVAALGIAITLSSCAGTTTNKQAESTVGSTQAERPNVTRNPDGTRTIVDHAGNKVTIPAAINRVAVDQIPIASTYLAYFDGSSPHLVGMNAAVVKSLRGTVAEKMAPEMFNVDSSYYDNGELNAETLVGLKPDVVFYNAFNEKHGQLLRQAGIPAVGFTTLGDPSVVYADWMRLLEDVFDEPGKMSAKIDYGTKLVNDAKARAAKASKQEDVMVIMRATQGKIMPAMGKQGWFTNKWAEGYNFHNVTQDINQNSAPVNAEQILTWNPSVIFVTGKGMSGMTAKPVRDNTLDGVDLNGVKALIDGRVYTTELGMWNWFTPNPDAPLVANWLGSKLYPEQFKDVDLVEMTREYYKVMYGYDLSEAQAQHILDPDAYPAA